MRSSRLAAVIALLASAACGEPPRAVLPGAPPPAFSPPPIAPPPLGLAPEDTPLGRLPADVRPTRYALDLWIDPARPRFAGVVDIAVELDQLRDVIWLHGRGLTVSRASVQPEGWPPLPARWEQVSPSGVARIVPESAVGPGRVTIHLEYDAAFETTEEGLYVVERGGERYAFTQLEAIYARRVFPCFDEPGFKAPFDLTLRVPRGKVAIANTRETARAAEGEGAQAWDRVAFAPTERLPTYLVAVAVGPLDVVTPPPLAPNAVRARPLPLRGVAVKGRGAELAYALGRAGAVVDALEAYFGSAYPYDKLDLVAVPEKNGAMENPGALTFGEPLLLLDAKSAPVEQRYEAETTLAHELSHQWFGDLVTMPWWDDIWLNEAFATWMETRIVSVTAPELTPRVRALESVHDAMNADALASARKIRQEIEDDNDIENAFDAITYDKGGAVLSMFEQWIGPGAFRQGIAGYLAAHRHGTATSGDLYAALSAAAGHDVAAPFQTFVDQPGLPLVEARLACAPSAGGVAAQLVLRQSRYLPVGSKGEAGAVFQIPVCARYSDGGELRRACTLLTQREGALPLPVFAGGSPGAAPGSAPRPPATSCPAWVMPNADAAGYYRFSLDAAGTQRLAKDGYGALDPLERMSFADSLAGSFARGTTPTAEVLAALAPFAADPSPAVAAAPMAMIEQLARWFEGDPLLAAVRAHARALYAAPYGALGWAPIQGAAETPDRALLRARVLDFLASVARDPGVRREAAARGRAYLGFGKDGAVHAADVGAVGPDLVGVALVTAIQDGGDALFDALLARLPREDTDAGRARILYALGSATAPALAARARELTLDPRLHPDEVMITLRSQLAQPETREAAWAWLAAHLDPILARLPVAWRPLLAWLGAVHCDRAHARELSKLFAPRVATIDGGPRNLAGAVEFIELCAARREAQEPSARAFFAKKR